MFLQPNHSIEFSNSSLLSVAVVVFRVRLVSAARLAHIV